MIEIIDGLLARQEIDPNGENAVRLRSLRARLLESVYLSLSDIRFVNRCVATLDNIECGALDHHARCTHTLCPERGRACSRVGERRFAECDYYIGEKRS